MELERIDKVQRRGSGEMSPGEMARKLCRRAKELQDEGRYEEAREALDPLWPGVGERPVMEGLDPAVAAEVLLRGGALTGYLGSAKQIAEAQEAAKNLLSEAYEKFLELGENDKTAEAQAELGVCYWREGAYDEARAMLRSAIERFSPNSTPAQRCLALLRLAIVEHWATRHHDALEILRRAAPLFERLLSHTLRGSFHNELGNVLEIIGTSENRQDVVDQAIVEYTAASFHFEQAGHTRYCARVENNLGFLFFTIRRFRDAHEHLDRARKLFTRLEDTGSVAQVDDTRARALLEEGKASEAERVARKAVKCLEKGDEQTVLAEAITTHGIALARLKEEQAAREAFERAIDLATRVGGAESAGLAILTMIEELAPARTLSLSELLNLYERADNLLKTSQHQGILKRLCAAARLVILWANRRVRATRVAGGEIEKVAARLVREANAQQGKSVLFTEAALAKMGDLHLGLDGENELKRMIEQTVHKARDKSVIEARAVEVVVLRNEPGLDFAEPWKGCSLEHCAKQYEARLIALALEDGKGQVSKAAALLGFSNYETLAWRLENRNKELSHLRKPVVRRPYRSIMRKGSAKKASRKIGH